jgi:hypothetical protein
VRSAAAADESGRLAALPVAGSGARFDGGAVTVDDGSGTRAGGGAAATDEPGSGARAGCGAGFAAGASSGAGAAGGVASRDSVCSGARVAGGSGAGTVLFGGSWSRGLDSVTVTRGSESIHA